MRLFLKYFLLFSLVLLYNNLTSGQESGIKNIFFGDIQNSSSFVESIAPINSEDILCVRYQGSIGNMFSRNKGNYTFDLVKNGNLPNSKPIKFKGKGRNTNLINYTFLGNAIIGLSHRSTMSSTQPNFFYHYINPQLKEKENHGFPLEGFGDYLRSTDISRIRMFHNKNRQFAGILYYPQTKSGEHSTIKYAVFEDDFKSPTNNIFIHPFSSSEFRVLDILIENKEKHVLVIGNYPNASTYNRGQQKSTHPYFDNITLNFTNQGEITTHTIKSSGIYYATVETLSTDSSIILTGNFSSQIEGNLEGVYFFEFDKDGQLIHENYSQFSTTHQIAIMDFKQNEAPNPTYQDVRYSRFNILSLEEIRDGYVSIVEYNAIEYQYGSANFAGTISSGDNTVHWSGDLLVTKISKNGDILWSKVIQKSQRTINDGGYYLSSSIYVGKNKIHLFFNDNLRNYGTDEKYNPEGTRPQYVNFGKNYTLAHVEIDNLSGDVIRTSLIGKTNVGTYIVPQLYAKSKKDNQLYIYSRKDKKSRFGIIYFYD